MAEKFTVDDLQKYDRLVVQSFVKRNWFERNLLGLCQDCFSTYVVVDIYQDAGHTVYVLVPENLDVVEYIQEPRHELNKFIDEVDKIEVIRGVIVSNYQPMSTQKWQLEKV